MPFLCLLCLVEQRQDGQNLVSERGILRNEVAEAVLRGGVQWLVAVRWMRRAGQVIQRLQLPERARVAVKWWRSNAGQSGLHAQTAGGRIRLLQGLLLLLQLFQNFSVLILWLTGRANGKIWREREMEN